jgi:hypothetical protein
MGVLAKIIFYNLNFSQCQHEKQHQIKNQPYFEVMSLNCIKNAVV